jgi:hypothetical protein
MSPAQIALLGAIAGFTIYIGLPGSRSTLSSVSSLRPMSRMT